VRPSARFAWDALWQALVSAAQAFLRNGLKNHAAATALYFLLSAAPLLILLAWTVQSLAALAPDALSTAAALQALYRYFDLDSLAQMGVIPSQRYIGASGVGLLTLVLAARGLFEAVQNAIGIIFAGERRRGWVVAWFIPLLAIPFALFMLGVALLSEPLLRMGLPADLAIGIKTLLLLTILYVLVFLAFSRLPADRPPWRVTAVFAALTALSLVGLFYGVGWVFKVAQFQKIYGAIGGVVFILIATYVAAMVFYFVAQFLQAYLEVDVRAFERLIIADKAARTHTLRDLPGMERLLHRYGQQYAPGEFLIHEGNQDDKSSFFIYSGTVRMTCQTRFLADFVAGDLFGEMAHLLGEARTASAMAVDEVWVLVLPPEMLETLMRQSPSVARDIIHALSARLKQMNLKVSLS
jgi:membrane protein